MLIKKYSILLIAVLPFFYGTGFLKKEKPVVEYADNWSGIISYSYTLIDKGERQDGDVKTEWNFKKIASISINVTGNNKGRATMSDELDKWQQITSPYIKQMKGIQIITEKETGTGSGEVEVWIEIDKDAGTYWLKTNGPDYDVVRESRIWDNIIEMAGGQQPAVQSTRISAGIAIDAPDQRIGSNPNLLTGSYVIFSSATHYVAVNWRLEKQTTRSAANTNPGRTSAGNTTSANNPRQGNQPSNNPSTNPSIQTASNNPSSLNAELIVSPENYQEWKPAAGTNASAPGNKLKTNLLFRNIGNFSQLKVVSFELKFFSTTSAGLSSTISNNPPDIRFLPSKNSILSDDGQFIKIQCADGFTGETIIASYHDRGSAILVAEAILNNGMRIKGNLLESGGPTEIPIPINTDQKDGK